MHASATVETKSVTRLVEQTEEIRVVTLTLTEAEAETIALITRMFVAGDATTRSSHIHAIRNALKGAGICCHPNVRIESFFRTVYSASNGFPNRSSMARFRNQLPPANEFRLMFKEGA